MVLYRLIAAGNLRPRDGDSSSGWLVRLAMACIATLGLFLTAAATPARAQSDAQHYAVAPRFDGIETSTFYIRSADGTRLAITLHRPTSQGVVSGEQLPVIVQQARGQSGNPRTEEAIRYFTSRGYVWLTQTRRGTGASFGSQTGFGG